MPENKKENVITLEPSTIETIDMAVFEFVNEEMDLHTTTNRGFKKVPVIWVSAERAFQSKRSKEMRDKEGALILPLISVERAGFEKDPTRKGPAWAHLPPVDDTKGGAFTITRQIKQDKTSNFANADTARARGQINFPRKNEKIVYETISIPLPVSINVNYIIKLRAEYQQQMNDLIQPFVTKTGNINHFMLNKDGHRYEGFIDGSFSSNSNVEEMGEDERMYETEINIRVLGHLVGEGPNQEKPKVVRRENAVEVKIPRERTILTDDDLDFL
tara:strand:- start:3842 stop:4660 length:819 start_codon:yes stop_codon:yes gene_type:complete